MLQFAHERDGNVRLRVVNVRGLHDTEAVLGGNTSRLGGFGFVSFTSGRISDGLTDDLVDVWLDGLLNLIGVLVGHNV